MSRGPVSDDVIEQYERDGAVLIKNALTVGTQRLLEAGVEEAHLGSDREATALSGANGAGQTVVSDYASNRSPILRALLEDGIVGGIAATLMRTSSAQLILDQIFYKSRGPIVATPWHQDTPFLRVRGNDLVRLWMPCDPSPRALTVQVVRGSHRWNVVYNTGVRPEGETPSTTKAVGTETGDGRGVGDPSLPTAPDIRRHRDSFDILTWDVEPGDVLAFQGNMLHGTDGHASHDRARRAFAVLLGGPALRYHAPVGKAFPSPARSRRLIDRDDIPDGDPIGNHETAFPVCWRAPMTAAV